MELSGGTLHVQEGTRVIIEGPVTWYLATDASLINDGTIEFGPTAMLEEPIGGPITGIGVETTTRTYSTAVLNIEPAGLGLSLTAASPIGPFTLVRGHEAFTLMNGGNSISRWFELQTNELTGPSLETKLRYDPTELNGLSALSLDLYTSLDPADFWTPRSGEPTEDPWAVSAEIFWPWGHITAFASDATTSIRDTAVNSFRAWPTATAGTVNLETLGDEAITHWELRDASGRLQTGMSHGASGVQYQTIDLSTLATGLYFLRVNDRVVIKLFKQ